MDEFETGQGGIGWFFNHLPTIMWQRRYWIVAPFVAVTAIAAIAAFSLPTLYRSTASLLVQSQDLPTSVVQAPNPGDIEQRIGRIRERVLSRGDLIRLIEQNNLYADERQSEPLSTIVEKMRKATTVGAQSNDIGSGQGTGATIAIDMSFDYSDPSLAQEVLQSYVNDFLSQDNEDVAEQARLSVRFLEDQANTLRAQVSSLEGQLTALKARNGSTLANTAAPVLDLGSYSSQIASLESQNRDLLVQISRASKKDPQIAAAEAAVAAAEALYNDNHPDVLTARERLRAVQQMVRANPPQDDTALLRGQVQANSQAIASLQAARSAAMARTQAALAGSARAPAIMEQAMQLENQAQALRGRYQKVADDLLSAQNSARLANEQRAERLSLVEPPNLPDTPHSPNRPLLIGAGAGVGLVLGLLLAFAVEFLRRPLRSPSQIEGLGLPVLGVVPLLVDKKSRKPARFALFRRKRPRLA
ncbi:lipopolysaccharide biosynthesis protein [Sphingomonas humi]|uniref:Lipopolysaccharide biosynthesis protein n=1 Tax=Sphingomonas humi TaxID=335630 RepID=A0ABP7RPZ9_9SPHN